MTPNELRARRKALGITQQEASVLLGIGLRKVQYLEAGANSGGAVLDEVPLLYEMAWCEMERRRQSKAA